MPNVKVGWKSSQVDTVEGFLYTQLIFRQRELLTRTQAVPLSFVVSIENEVDTEAFHLTDALT